MEKTKNEVKVCPTCNSQDISLYSSKAEQYAALFRYICNNCGYEGPMTVMEKKDANKLKVLKPKRTKKKK